jgi:SurA-like protein
VREVNWRHLAIVALALSLSACGTRAPIAGQLIVNGQAVSLALYNSLVTAAQHRAEQVGVRADAASPVGRKRLASIETSVIHELVRDAVVEQLALARGIRVTPQQLEQRLVAAEQAFGGPSAFYQAVQSAGLKKSDFSTLLRYRMLETQLAQVSAGDVTMPIDNAVSHARVVVTIGPCADGGLYPACLTTP